MVDVAREVERGHGAKMTGSEDARSIWRGRIKWRSSGAESASSINEGSDTPPKSMCQKQRMARAESLEKAERGKR
jgi:hypothetical protein